MASLKLPTKRIYTQKILRAKISISSAKNWDPSPLAHHPLPSRHIPRDFAPSTTRAPRNKDQCVQTRILLKKSSPVRQA